MKRNYTTDLSVILCLPPLAPYDKHLNSDYLPPKKDTIRVARFKLKQVTHLYSVKDVQLFPFHYWHLTNIISFQLRQQHGIRPALDA